MTELCSDCPDHEACMTSYPCEVVKHHDMRSRMTDDERMIADKLTDAGLTPEEATKWVFDVMWDAMIRGGQEALVDALHPDFGTIWEPPLPDGEGGMTEGGQVWVALRNREAELVGLAEEVARYHPGCVMPESYSPSMYKLAQAAVKLIEALGVNEDEVAMRNEEIIDG